MVEMIQAYLKDEIELEYGKGLPKDKRKVGEFPVYGSNGIVDFNDKPYFKGPRIVIGRKGTVGSVKYEEKDFWAIDTTYVVKLKNKNEDLKFWYYLLQTLGLENMNSHSAVPGLNRDRVYDITISIPKSQKDRKKVAKILSMLDEKIKVNNQVNNNLLEIGLLLVNKYFDEENDNISLENIIKFIKGKKPRNITNIKKENYGKYLTIACLNNQELNYADADKMIIANHDLLMVMDGASSGDIYYSDYGVVGSTLARINIIDERFNKGYIYFCLKKYNKLIKSKNTGSAIPHTDKVFVSSLEIAKIGIEKQQHFIKLLSKIQENKKENNNLEQLRDALLLKLMNGEIDLENIEI